MIEISHKGRTWRAELRAPSCLDLLRAGAGLPLHRATLAILEAGPAEGLPLSERQEGMLRLREILEHGREGIRRATSEQVGWLLAGVVALGVDEPPGPVRLVRSAAEEREGQPWVGRIPGAVRSALHRALQDLALPPEDGALITRVTEDRWLLDAVPLVLAKPNCTVLQLLALPVLELNLQIAVALHVQRRGLERIDTLNSQKVPVFPVQPVTQWA